MKRWATRRTEKLQLRKRQRGFGAVTYLVRRAAGLKQVTDRAGAKSSPTSLLRDLGGRKTVNREQQQREDAKAAARPAQI